MMRPLWPFLLLTACESGTIQIVEDLPDTDAPTSDTPTDTPGPSDTPGETEDTPAAPLADLSEPGPQTVDVTQGRFPMDGCDMDYVRYAPQARARDTTVILSHGFMRSPAQMAGWARHLASWGYVVITPSLCHANVLDADHARNAAELARLVDVHLQGAPVVFAGHSAGGLASLLAGAASPQAIAVLGLDLVDTDDLGVQAAPRINVPVGLIAGEPNWACNSDGNGVNAVAAADDHRIVKISDASHCDFESPTNAACSALCEQRWPPPAFSDRAQANAIGALVTAFVLGMTGDDPRALQYWTAGQARYDDLASTGILTAL